MSKKKKIIKISILVTVVLFCIALTILIIYLGSSLFNSNGTISPEGQKKIEEIMDKLGIFGPVVYVLAEIFQIILALIPGGPVEILGGVLFHPLLALLLCEIGIFTATFIVHKLVQKIGKPIVNMFVSEEKFSKFKFLRDEKKLELVAFIFLMIPGTPKDVITYIVSLTDIKGLRFYILAAVARIPALTLCIMFGNSVQEGNFMLMIIISAIVAVVGITGILLGGRITDRRRKRVEQRVIEEKNGKPE